MSAWTEQRRAAEVVLVATDADLGRRLRRVLAAQRTAVRMLPDPAGLARAGGARIVLVAGAVSTHLVADVMSTGGAHRVVVVGDERFTDVAALLRAGVMAVVLGAEATRELPAALEAVAAGALYLSRSCIDGLRQVLRQAARPATGLAPREIETLSWIARGCTHREVAHHMGVTEATVNTYVKRLRSKLRAGNKAELASAAVRLGLIHG